MSYTDHIFPLAGGGAGTYFIIDKQTGADDG